MKMASRYLDAIFTIPLRDCLYEGRALIPNDAEQTVRSGNPESRGQIPVLPEY